MGELYRYQRVCRMSRTGLTVTMGLCKVQRTKRLDERKGNRGLLDERKEQSSVLMRVCRQRKKRNKEPQSQLVSCSTFN